MSKKTSRSGPPRLRPEPAPRPVQTTEPPAGINGSVSSSGPVSALSVQHVVCPFSDFKEQDAQIEMMGALGYEHYESIPLGGNELLLRFRTK